MIELHDGKTLLITVPSASVHVCELFATVCSDDCTLALLTFGRYNVLMKKYVNIIIFSVPILGSSSSLCKQCISCLPNLHCEMYSCF